MESELGVSTAPFPLHVLSEAAVAMDRELLGDVPPLVLARVELSSPGFWDFMGSFSVLEQFRKFLWRQVEPQQKQQKDDACLGNVFYQLCVSYPPCTPWPQHDPQDDVSDYQRLAEIQGQAERFDS